MEREVFVFAGMDALDMDFSYLNEKLLLELPSVDLWNASLPL
jgi:hypothetical protein